MIHWLVLVANARKCLKGERRGMDLEFNTNDRLLMIAIILMKSINIVEWKGF